MLGFVSYTKTFKDTTAFCEKKTSKIYQKNFKKTSIQKNFQN